MTPTPDYVRIVDHITARIRAGDLQPGQRLPTYGQLAEEYEVGVSTVGAAFRILRERGLVTGQPGKATYVADRTDEAR